MAPYNDGPRLLQDIWGLTGLGIVVVGLRIVARLRIHRFKWEDVLMIFALVGISPLLLSIYYC